MTLPKMLPLIAIVCLCAICAAGCQFDGNANRVSIDNSGHVAPVEKIKAGFIYFGPIGDYGWSGSHDLARKIVSQKYADWLETEFVESVPENDAFRHIDRLVNEEKCNVIFANSAVYQNAMFEASHRYPNVIFMQCAGTKSGANLGSYFAEIYQIFYLNGVMAGALTKTGKIGYVASYPSSEVIRHIDAFALGLKVASPTSRVFVKWINNWYDPDKAKNAAEALIDQGIDTLAFTEDSPAVVQVAQSHTEKGKPLYVFGHYSPMQQFGETSVVSGQLVDWSSMYEDILMSIHVGTWTNADLWWRVAEGAAQLGAEIDKPVNPRFIDALKAVTVKTPSGFVSAYDFVMSVYQQFKSGSFEPFSGPLMDQNGILRIPAGSQLTMDQLRKLDWFVDNVQVEDLH